jgi:hypothetical protein
MLRSFVSLIVGILAGGLTVAIGEALSHQLFPPPPGADFSTREGAAAAIAAAPMAARWTVIAVYVVGAAVGGFVATRLARADTALAALAVGGVLTLGGISNIISFPHPWWMVIATLVVFIPAALAGGRLARR